VVCVCVRVSVCLFLDCPWAPWLHACPSLSPCTHTASRYGALYMSLVMPLRCYPRCPRPCPFPVRRKCKQTGNRQQVLQSRLRTDKGQRDRERPKSRLVKRSEKAGVDNPANQPHTEKQLLVPNVPVFSEQWAGRCGSQLPPKMRHVTSNRFHLRRATFHLSGPTSTSRQADNRTGVETYTHIHLQDAATTAKTTINGRN